MTMMKSYLYDLIGLVGFFSASYGVFLLWGLGTALISGGISAMVISVVKQWEGD